MANLRFYKDFYCINHTSFDIDAYSFIDPIGISANTYVSGSTTVLENLIIQNESIGKYFVDLNPQFYASDYVYELKWSVVYITNSAEKQLKTYFKINPNKIITPFDIEINQTNNIEIEIK